jgi:rhamnosyltransferase subunit B
MYPPLRQRGHFIVVTIGSAGDLFPFLRLALTLAQRGHRVDVVAPEPHQPFVAQTGLPFHGLPVDLSVLDDPGLWDARKGFGVVWRATRPALALLQTMVTQLSGGEPCVLLVHPLALPESDLCRAALPGVRIAAAYLAPSNIMTVYDPLTLGSTQVPAWVPHGVRRWIWRAAGQRIVDPHTLPGLNAARMAAGLAPVARFLDYLHSVPDLSLTLFPAWFGAHQPDWPAPLVTGDFALYDPTAGAPFTPALAAFLDHGDAPIVFTHGTGNRQAAQFFACALAAAGRLGRRAILLTPHREQVAAHLPPDVLWQEYLPLRSLLPRAVALVHHGGIGTTAEALRAGVPQLVVPLAHDQFDNAARVVGLGVGLCLAARRARPRAMAACLERLLDSGGIGANCSGVRTCFAPAPAWEPVLQALEDLVVQHSGQPQADRRERV